MKKIAVTFIFALSCITINAQIDQIFKPIILQLEEGNGIKEYVVNNYSHSNSSYSTYEQESNINLVLSFKEYTINGTELKQIKSYSY